jgi:ABC-type bacteriocin/lantibiotic exporter with double-glycine peptidase domain
VINILHEYKGTKLMITHRQNLLKYFDKIVVVKKV